MRWSSSEPSSSSSSPLLSRASPFQPYVKVFGSSRFNTAICADWSLVGEGSLSDAPEAASPMPNFRSVNLRPRWTSRMKGARRLFCPSKSFSQIEIPLRECPKWICCALVPIIIQCIQRRDAFRRLRVLYSKRKHSWLIARCYLAW